MKKLSIEHIFDIGIGAAILGSGGGTDPEISCMMAKKQMEKGEPVKLISYSDLKPDDVILPIGTMGAPSAEAEKLVSGKEFEIMFEYIKKSLNKKIIMDIFGLSCFFFRPID